MTYSIDIQNLDALKRKIRVTVEAKEVGAMYDKIASDLTRNIRLPGFRPGKVPRDFLVKRFGTEIAAETASKIIDQVSPKAITQTQLPIVGITQVVPETLTRENPFVFDMTVEVRPEITLKKYKKLKLQRPKYEPDPAEIDRRLEQMRQERAELAPLIAPRPAKSGDIAIVDYSATIADGQPEQQQAYTVEIGQAQIHPDFDAALTGMEPGQTKSIELTFADDDTSESLRGQAAHFEVTLQDLKQKNLPALDDEFAKSVDGSATLLELRIKIGDAMTHSANHEINHWVEQEVLKQLIEENPFDVPASVVHRIQEQKAHRYVEELQRRGVNTGQIQQEHIDKLAEGFQPAAQRDAQAMFLLDQIAKDEGLKVSEDELTARIKEISVEVQMPEAQVRAQLSKEGGVENLREQMLNEKTLKFILENAKVDEIDMKKWRKMLDERAAATQAISEGKSE